MTQPQGKIPLRFFRRTDPVCIARELIGTVVISRKQGIRTAGRVVETEAYCHQNDRACHAYAGRITRRNRVMYENGGCAYLYLCYGIHHLFNVVTNGRGKADAVLIRALEPLEGLQEMQRRRGMKTVSFRLTAGPGSLSQALGLTVEDSGRQLNTPELYFQYGEDSVPGEAIQASPRVGIGYAGPDARLPWRFRLIGSAWTSPAK